MFFLCTFYFYHHYPSNVMLIHSFFYENVSNFELSFRVGLPATCLIGFSVYVPYLDTDVLVHVLRGSVTVLVPLCAVVVPVVPRGTLPVHHLQRL